MDSESKFWIIVCALTALVLITITVATVGYNLNRDRLMAEGIASGGDPMMIRCAYDTVNLDAVCLVRAAGGAK